MVAVVGAVVQVDDVDGRHAALDKGQMVVFDRLLGLEEVAVVAEFVRGLAHQVDQPAGGSRFTLDVEVLVADHVGQHEGFDLAQRAVASPFGGQMAAAVGGVGGGPVWNRLFAVEEDQPDGVAVELACCGPSTW